MTKKLKEQLGNAEKFERPEPLPLRRPARPANDYPLKSLGKFLGDTVAAIVDMVQCPVPIAANSVMATASLAVQAHVDVEHPKLKRKRVPLSLFLVTRAPSGERKSAADDLATRPAQIREAELREERKADQRTFKVELAIYEKKKNAILANPPPDWKVQLAKLGPEPLRPPTALLTTRDPTIEGLHRLYAEAERSIGLLSDEGGTFIGGHGMKDETILNTAAGLSDLWDGKPVKRVRGIDGVTILPGCRLAMHLMAQPGVADGLLNHPVIQRQGLNSRLLISAPASLVGTRMQRPTKASSQPALDRYEAGMLKLFRKPRPTAPNDLELRPRVIRLSKEALEVWKAFADECEIEQREGGRFEGIIGFAGKLPEHAVRIAGVLEIVEDVDAKCLSASTLLRGIEIAKYHAEEWLRLSEEDIPSPEFMRADKMLKWLHKKGKRIVGLKELSQFGPNGVRKVKFVQEAMKILVEYNWAIKLPDGTKLDNITQKEAWEVIN